MRRGLLLATIVLMLAGVVAPSGSSAGDGPPASPPAPADGAPAAGAPTGARYEGEPASAWADRLGSTDLALRRKAAWALWNLSDAADVATAPLVQALADEDRYVRDTALRTLGRRREPSKADAARAAALLGHDREETRHAAASLLFTWGPLVPEAIPSLTTALAAEDEKVRELAAAALGRCGHAARGAWTGLSLLLDDDFPDVRVEAAGALARIDLLTALGHAHREVRIAALRQLDSIPFAELSAVRDALPPLLKDDDREVRAGAAVIMSTALLARDASTWRMQWAKPLRDAARAEGSSYVRMHMTTALSRLPESRGESTPILLDWTRSADAGLRAASVLAFRELGDPEGVAKERVLETMRDPDAGVRRTSALALPVVAKGDVRVVPALATALSDGDKFTATNAAQSLGALGDAAAAAVPDLVRCLDRSRHPAMRVAAAHALRQIGGAAREAALPVLDRAIAEDAAAPLAFHDAVLHLDARPRKDVADRILAAALGDDEIQRNIAGAALQRAEERSQLLAPGLLSALTGSDATRRERALRALARFRPVPPEAQAAIRKAMSDPDAGVAAAAKHALDTMDR
jgi:HEAT repeat protein